MISKKGYLIICLLFIFLNMYATVWAGDESGSFYMQPMFGKMILGEDDENVKGSSYDLTMLGAAVQKALNASKAKKAFEYGIECGAIASWENDVRTFNISSGPSGGTVAVVAKNKWFLGDFFFGGFASYNLGKWARIYVGAGPLIVYGRRHVRPEGEDGGGATPVEDLVEDDSGAGLYGRTGLEFYITEKILLGASARFMKSNLTFNHPDDPMGDIDVEGVQGFLTFAVKL